MRAIASTDSSVQVKSDFVNEESLSTKTKPSLAFPCYYCGPVGSSVHHTLSAMAAEITGLVLGALGISGLFTACIENLDIVMRARHFERDFDLLCAKVILMPVPRGHFAGYTRMPIGPR